MELVAGSVEEGCPDTSSTMSGGYEEAHYRARKLAGIVQCYFVVTHVDEVSSRLSVAPANGLTVGVGEEALGFASADLFRSSGSMLGTSFRCWVPVISYGVIETAEAAGPVGKV